MKLYNEVNNHVLSVINDDSDMLAIWNESENQKKLKRIISRNAPKKKKDKNAPKKFSSAYILYGNDIRPDIIKKNPKFSAQDIFREAGAQWKQLAKKNPKKLEEYQKRSDLDKERYKEEMAAYIETHKDDVDENLDTSSSKKKTKKEKKPDNGLEKPKSCYQYFCQDFRKQLSENPEDKMSQSDIFKECGARWKDLKTSDTEKYQEYVNMGKLDKERYEMEKNALTVDVSNVKESKKTKAKVKVPAKNVKEVAKVAVKDKDKDNKTEKKAPTNYNKFCSIRRAELKKEGSFTPAEITAELTSQWKGMSDEEKGAYANL